MSSVDYSPNGSVLASRSREGRVRLWDVARSMETATLLWPGGHITAFAFSPDGDVLACGGRVEPRGPNGVRGEVRLSSRVNGRPLWRIGGGWNGVRHLAFSPDGRTLVVVAGGRIELREVETGELRCTLKREGGYIDMAVFSPNGTILLAGGESFGIGVWDPRSGKCLRTIQAHHDGVCSLAFSPDGKRLAVGTSYASFITLQDVKTGKLMRHLPGHTNDMRALAYSADGRHIYSGAEDGTLRIWDARRGSLLVTCFILPSTRPDVRSTDWIAFTPDGYFTGSPRASRFTRWRMGTRILPSRDFERRFHRPDKVRQALA